MPAVSLTKRKRVTYKPEVDEDFDEAAKKTKTEEESDSESESESESDNEDEQDKEDHTVGGISVSEDGIPYNYIVVIDAGSHGSRAYVYNYLSKSTGEKLPQVEAEQGWNAKIEPGLSALQSEISSHDANELADIVGKQYLGKLLKKVGKIVPKDQHERTPIFLHATAGMRLLNTTDQNTLLGAACRYMKQSTDFFLPDCKSHVNIIGGDEEGLYGWIALNYLSKSLDKERVSHGLLELGGASTQVSFQPNEEETVDHVKQLMTLDLGTVGAKEPDLRYQVYSKSFLGFGMYQMHDSYLRSLVKLEVSESDTIQDPCMPHNHSKTKKIGGKKYRFKGAGNYKKCREVVYQVLAEKDKENPQCSKDVQKETSKCLLNDTIPAFDFNFENFYGVSGYWDTVSKLLDIDGSDSVDAQQYKQYGKVYAYDEIEKETAKVCSLDWDTLAKYKDLDHDELAQLCFKSTYMIDLLHNGLGMSKNGTAKFQVNDQINGSDFTWTLGRAVLYASDESAEGKMGYYRNAKPTLFIRGAEQSGVKARPIYSGLPGDPGHEATTGWGTEDGVNHWSIFSFFVIVPLLCILYWKRVLVLSWLDKVSGGRIATRFGPSAAARNPYRRVDLEAGSSSTADIQLQTMGPNLGSSSDILDDPFKIDDSE